MCFLLTIISIHDYAICCVVTLLSLLLFFLALLHSTAQLSDSIAMILRFTYIVMFRIVIATFMVTCACCWWCRWAICVFSSLYSSVHMWLIIIFLIKLNTKSNKEYMLLYKFFGVLVNFSWYWTIKIRSHAFKSL